MPRLPEHAGFLDALPNPISRQDVAAQFVNADASEDATIRAFLAAMVWGHGRNGYGAYRTAGVLTATDHAGARLRETLQVTRANGGPAGFDHLARNRLKGLGVAFATKYLFFCLADHSTVPTAPILDRIVCNWLSAHIGWRPRLDWRLEDYKRYCSLVTDWSTHLQEAPATVEYLMFASGIGATSQWTDPILTDTSESATATLGSDAAAVLDALDEAAEAFEALPGGVTAEDADDFERGLRALRRIVVARAQSFTNSGHDQSRPQ